MTPDMIIAAFETAEMPPVDALRAGLAHADALAPRVFALLDKLCAGVYLLPPQRGLLFHGLPVLAAVRHPGLSARLDVLVRQPEEDLDFLFPDRAGVDLARLLLSVWEGDGDALFQTIEHADICEPALWALFDVLARLTFEGRIDRARTAAFLERFEKDKIAGDDDTTWWCWEDAVTRLGLVELEPALRRVWTKDINKEAQDEEQAESLAELAHAAAHPDDPAKFDEAEIRAIDDPVEATSWVERRAVQLAQWQAEEAAEAAAKGETAQDGESGPVFPSQLTDDEIDWLDGFLVSRQAPSTTMPLEMVDGFLTALAIGPETVPKPAILAEIWGTGNGQQPAWDSPEQEAHVLGLLDRHALGIAEMAAAKGPIEPLLASVTDDEMALEWAAGFQAGIEARASAWEPIERNKRGNNLLMAIFALTGEDDDDDGAEDLTPEARAEIVEDLPILLQMIAAFWRDGAAALPGQTPARSTKVGRNVLCPCGSGKKYKKCCGADPVTLH